MTVINAKFWDGVKWQPRIKTLKKWDGSKWIDTSMMKWDGKNWSNPYRTAYKKTYTKTWVSSWSGSYQENGSLRPVGTLGRMYQGKYGKYDPTANLIHNPIYWGKQRSLFGFQVSELQSQLRFATIKKIEVYLYMSHSWYYSGATASLCTHNFTTKPNTFNLIDYNIASHKFTQRNSGAWIEIPIKYGQDLATGRINGFGLYRDSTDQIYYSYYDGATNNNPPKIRITYEVLVDSSEQPIGLIDTVTQPALYYTVPEGFGLDAVTRDLISKGEIINDFAKAKQLLIDLNGFSSTNPVLLIGQKILYKSAITS